MKRPLALYERVLYLDGQLPVNVMIMACIRGHIAEDRMHQALARVQAKHPILRSLIVSEVGRPWFELQASPPPIPLRVLERQSSDAWIDASTHELLQRFDGNQQPLARLAWLRGEDESELVLICHHAVCDGLSLVTLLREILLLCDQPDRDIGSYSTLDTFEDLVPAEVLTDRRLQRKIRRNAALLKAFLWFARPLVRQPDPDHPYGVYGKVYRNFWALDDLASRALLERCKAEGVSAFIAISVSIMLAFRAVRGAKGAKKFQGSVDLRRYLPGLKADSLFPTSATVPLSLGRTPDGGSAEADFWALTRMVKADMTQKIGRLGPTVYARLLALERLHGSYGQMLALGVSRPAERPVTLSYLGRLELAEDYHDFRLQAIRGISGMLEPSPANLLAISSFAGRFEFSLGSDEHSLPHEQAVQIQEKAMAMLHSYTAPKAQPA
ncbi:MAG: condensation domain-containing protein [Luteimonas sp.]